MHNIIYENQSPVSGRRCIIFFVVAIFALIGSGKCFAVDTIPTVTLSQGVLTGVRQGDVESFKGIPYAAAPVGDLRWRPPQPAPAWHDTRDASQFANDCMQTPVSWDDTPATAPTSEDCLHLNVWRPHGANKLPVLVWIHGGGFVNGASSAVLYDGAHFARDGMVFVSLDYRLGRFGFFAHPAISADHPDEPKGNYGYMDQIAALRWVHDNITAFGGDAEQVTVMGESAGGGSVLMLLNAPGARGLFARAIVQSGGGTDFSENRRIAETKDGKVSAEEVGIAFANSVGIEGRGADALRALRRLSPEKIVGDLNMATLNAGKDLSTYPDPMIDGQIVVAPIVDRYAQRLEANVPLLIGTTSADISHVAAQSKDEVFAAFGAAQSAARQAYDPDGTVPLDRLAAQIGADRFMGEPARFAARAFSEIGAAVYEYRFSYVPPALKETSPNGAGHFSDVPFVFVTQDRFRVGQTAPGDAAVAATIHAYWVNFAKSGDPNGAGLPHWPRYSAVRDELLDFGEYGAVGMTDPWKARLDAVAASRPGSK